MTHPDKSPTLSNIGDLDKPIQNPNALNLDETLLGIVAGEARYRGLTSDQLTEVYNGKLVIENPLLSHVIGRTADDIKKESGDLRSFHRGAALAYYLIDSASMEGAPIMGIGSMGLASQYQDQPGTLEALQAASDGILGSQTELSQAFDKVLDGMPEGTEPTMARFGGGIVLLGEMAAAQFGGSGVEGWFDADPH